METMNYWKEVRYIYEYGNYHWINYMLHLEFVLYHLQCIQSRYVWVELLISRYVGKISRHNVIKYVLSFYRK